MGGAPTTRFEVCVPRNESLSPDAADIIWSVPESAAAGGSVLRG
jgi:hypothetical protein